MSVDKTGGLLLVAILFGLSFGVVLLATSNHYCIFSFSEDLLNAQG
jgi:hypothetical protein